MSVGRPIGHGEGQRVWLLSSQGYQLTVVLMLVTALYKSLEASEGVRPFEKAIGWTGVSLFGTYSRPPSASAVADHGPTFIPQNGTLQKPNHFYIDPESISIRFQYNFNSHVWLIFHESNRPSNHPRPMSLLIDPPDRITRSHMSLTHPSSCCCCGGGGGE